MKLTLLFTIVFLLAALPLTGTPAALAATTWYVDDDGPAAGNGSETAPWRTIQQCAEAMASGDACMVRGGNYRETVTVRQDDVEFRAFDGEEVVLTGLDVVEGWQPCTDCEAPGVHQVKVGQKVMQVFVNGQRMDLARFPNNQSIDMLAPDLGVADGGADYAPPGLSWIQDDLLEQQPYGAWNGATVWFLTGSKWVAFTGRVESHVGDAIYFSFVKGGILVHNHYRIQAGTEYFITNSRRAMDAEREWYQAADGTLYLKPPGGAAPGTLLVEARTRGRCLDFNGHAKVRVSGINLFAASLTFNNATDSLYEHGRVFYPEPYFDANGFTRYTDLGNLVDGERNTMRNSEVAFSWGNGLGLYGNENRVENCVIHDVDWSCTNTAPLNVRGSNHVITNNSLYDTCRSGVAHGEAVAISFRYNHVYRYGRLATDLAAFYAYDTNGYNTEIAYNWIHDADPAGRGGLHVGVYPDNDTSNMLIHHNVIWNVAEGIRTNTTAVNHQIYNNVFWNVDVAMSAWYREDKEIINQKVYNNLSSEGTFLATDQQNNLVLPGAAGSFADADAGDFRPLAEAAVIDAGISISGITDDHVGAAPDVGAYEYFGGAVSGHWTPGPVTLLGEALRLEAEQAGMHEVAALSATDVRVGDGDWLRFEDVELGLGFGRLRLRYTATTSGRLELRQDALDGLLLAELQINPGGDFVEIEGSMLRGRGRHDLLAVFRGGEEIAVVDWLELTAPRPLQAPLTSGHGGTPGNGLPWSLDFRGMVRVEAENFNQSYPCAAYFDTSPGQAGGGTYRPDEDVDTRESEDLDGDQDVSWTEAGEWLNYTIRSPGGKFALDLRGRATGGEEALLRLSWSQDGGAYARLADLHLPPGEGDGYSTVHLDELTMPKGVLCLRVEILSGSPDLNWFAFTGLWRPGNILGYLPAILRGTRPE